MTKIKPIKGKETKIDRKIKSYFPMMAFLAVLFVIFIVLYFSLQGLGKVNYQGLSFTKEKLGEILFYRYDYVVESSGGGLIANKLYLRNDPRKVSVPVEGEIVYPQGKKVYISVNGSGLEKCEYGQIAMTNLGLFLGSNNLKFKTGFPDKEEAIKNNQSYINCNNYLSNPVLLIQYSNESKIQKTGEYCYNLNVANCEILQVVEKFIVQSILDAKNYAEKGN